MELYQPSAANRDWVEGGSNGAVENGASSGANKIEPGTAWDGGPLLGSTGFGPLLASASFTPPALGIFDRTISDAGVATALIDDFLSGANEGFLLKGQDESFDGTRKDVVFFSSEFATIASRPQLIVDYEPAPEPNAALLLLAGAALLATRRRA